MNQTIHFVMASSQAWKKSDSSLNMVTRLQAGQQALRHLICFFGI